ncbi:MAG: multiheme c-type cytochrome [Myxococcales bacterium]
MTLAVASDAAVRPGEATLRPSLRVAIVPDLSGTLEPCGCTRDTAGGIDRLAAALDALAREPVPLLKLATGAVFARPNDPVHSRPQREQAELRTEAMTAALQRLDLDALALRTEDLTAYAPRLAQLVRAGRPHLLGLASHPELNLQGSALLGEHVGVVSTLGENWSMDSATSRIATRVNELRSQGARLVILVADAETSAADRATNVGADLVIRSDGRPDTSKSEVGAAVELRGGYQGEGLWVLDIWRNDDQSPGLQLLKQAPAATDPAPGHAVLATYRRLDRQAPQDPTLRRLLDQLFARINERNAALALDEPTAQAGAKHTAYVGSKTCAACHTQAYFWWLGTQHGRAYASLQARKRELDLDCVGCHVTGFAEPGGANLASLTQLAGVGCESCHGPGGKHVDDPRRIAPEIHRQVGANKCISCHDAQHSDPFEYEKSRAALLTPAHGGSGR